MNNQPEEPINSVLPTALPAWVISSMKYKSNRLLKLTRNVASPGGRVWVARPEGNLANVPKTMKSIRYYACATP